MLNSFVRLIKSSELIAPLEWNSQECDPYLPSGSSAFPILTYCRQNFRKIYHACMIKGHGTQIVHKCVGILLIEYIILLITYWMILWVVIQFAIRTKAWLHIPLWNMFGKHSIIQIDFWRMLVSCLLNNHILVIRYCELNGNTYLQIVEPQHRHVLGTWSYKYASHDDVIKWKHFPRYWPFVRGIHRSPVNSPHKGQWRGRGTLILSLICVWINGWVNNREAGDLRRYRARYDITVMCNYYIDIT